jgi:hypothetical protein
MAHVCLTTTVSLTCSIGNEEEFTIPSGFFFDSSALALVLDDIQSLVCFDFSLLSPCDA